MHTVASTHAYSNLHDYIAQAKLKGIKLFAITDHGTVNFTVGVFDVRLNAAQYPNAVHQTWPDTHIHNRRQHPRV
jgi:histidinol phosphatase-like PHP family hydrolase